MTEKEKKILETFKKIIPKMSENGKDNMLSYGEGIADAIERYGANSAPPEKKPA